MTARAAPDPAASLQAGRTAARLPIEAVRAEAMRLGFDAMGVAPLQPSDHAAFYRAWIEAGYHGEMHYLARPDAVEKRIDPAAAWPGLRSAIVLALNYHTSEEGEPADASRGIIARYARGRDYHRVIVQRLRRLLDFIERLHGSELPLARAYVDTGPVLERELARRAGLGWFGRNTMIIHPRRGSWFFLATLLLEIELEPDAPFERDYCGTCHACLHACPTGALLGRDANGAPLMDARRCISYLTIEHRGTIPRELRPLIGNRVFGCDICQEVCPFNRKFPAPTADPSFAARGPGQPPAGVELEPGISRSHPGTDSPPLIALLETALDEAAWDVFSRGSPVRRAGRAGFARNVCIALGNWRSPAAVPVLTRALADPEPLVRAHAAWALGRTGSEAARSALAARLAAEPDGQVREEIDAAAG